MVCLIRLFAVRTEYFGKVVILVNEYTQSRGEFTAQALRKTIRSKSRRFSNHKLPERRGSQCWTRLIGRDAINRVSTTVTVYNGIRDAI